MKFYKGQRWRLTIPTTVDGTIIEVMRFDLKIAWDDLNYNVNHSIAGWKKSMRHGELVLLPNGILYLKRRHNL